MKHFLFRKPVTVLMTATVAGTLLAEERTLTPEQMEAIAKQGELDSGQNVRPAKLPDLTKGEPMPVTKKPPKVWTFGPTGVAGIMVGSYGGDQIQVQATVKGSPSDGKFLPGDVLIGINGKKFQAGGHLGQLIGKAIIEAELNENEGKISFLVWRDKNFIARSGKKDVVSVDVDKLFKQARDDNSLYEWKSEEQRTNEVKQEAFDKFPIDPVNLEISLTLRTFPAYSDTAPYDCPKTEAILEDAWKVLERKFVKDPKNKRSGRGGVLEAIALVASGKPEHRELVKKWVRSPHAKFWHPPTEPAGEMFKPGWRGHGGYQTWHHGFTGLNCAIYYEATGDDFVLPALRKWAINAAMGQSGHGSWGHTFAFPSFNGGELHGMNPGYGALNAAGNRCFFLVTLAQHLGIKHPEIDLAVERAHKFFGSYVDQGAIPYGDHGAAATDDSNGKNTGVAFSMKLLGDKHGAKYFAMMSSHCAFTRRGGHGHDYHGNWSSWAAGLCGPKVRAYNERNLRWRRTLCRMFDGSFVYDGSYGPLRDPTATHVLHQAVYLKQTIITGKDPDPDLYPTEREMKQLMSSGRAQFNDPWLMEIDGTKWNERSTDEVIDLLDIFKPKVRGLVGKELAKRYWAGEKEIVTKVLKHLTSEEPRFRDGALRTLGACGKDVVLEHLTKLIPLLNDPKDFVRVTAVRVIGNATDAEETQTAMLKAVADTPKAIAPNSVRNSAQGALFGKDNTLSNTPFDAGRDEEVIRQTLEDLILLDPAGRSFMVSRLKAWNKDTVIRLAGSLTYAAEREQLADQMFANRSGPARALLNKFKYREAFQSTADRLRRQAAIPRHIRPHVGFKRPLMDPDVVKARPAVFKEYLDDLAIVVTDNPNAALSVRVGKKMVTTRLDSLYELIAAQKAPEILPAVYSDVRRLFQEKLDEADGKGAKIKLCRAALSDPQSRAYFRMIAAMDSLTEILGADALDDLVPYLGHDYWRVRDHSRKLTAEFVTAGAGEALAGLFGKAAAEDVATAAGILDVLAANAAKAGLKPATQALTHDDAELRAAGLRTIATLEGIKALPQILAHLNQSNDPVDFIGCEDALLLLAKDPGDAATIRDAAIAALPKLSQEAKAHTYYVLARIGDSESIAALRKAGETDSIPEFRDIVFALSYAHSREADKVLLDFARADKINAKLIGAQAVRRMVLGPAGFGDITDAERMDFAEPMLKLNMDRKLISYLGHVHHPRALRALMYCLKNGVPDAAESLVANAEGLPSGLPDKEVKIAAKAIRDVIEYIEVSHLRGGPTAHMRKEDKYYVWKALQARAGKALLKVYQPEKQPIPEFDPLDLDP